jgi:hypothetical protein
MLQGPREVHTLIHLGRTAPIVQKYLLFWHLASVRRASTCLVAIVGWTDTKPDLGSRKKFARRTSRWTKLYVQCTV